MIAENNGFSTNEYRDSYKLFNKTVIKPIQISVIDVFDKILGVKDSITIAPFTIEFDDNNDKNAA